MDLGGRERTAFGDRVVSRVLAAVGACVRFAGYRCGRGAVVMWYVEDVELAARCGLGGRGTGGVVRDVVAVDDVLWMTVSF